MRFLPDQERSGDQLKKKFNTRTQTKMGTGDPTMPADVREAKEIQWLIMRSHRVSLVLKMNLLL
jgi:hypothetical protein